MKYWILSGFLVFMQSWIMASQQQTYDEVLAAFFKKREYRQAEKQAILYFQARIVAWVNACQFNQDNNGALHQGYDHKRKKLTQAEEAAYQEMDTFCRPSPEESNDVEPALHRSIGARTPFPKEEL